MFLYKLPGEGMQARPLSYAQMQMTKWALERRPDNLKLTELQASSQAFSEYTHTNSAGILGAKMRILPHQLCGKYLFARSVKEQSFQLSSIQLSARLLHSAPFLQVRPPNITAHVSKAQLPEQQPHQLLTATFKRTHNILR